MKEGNAIFIALSSCYWTQIKQESEYQPQREGRIHTSSQELKFVQTPTQNSEKPPQLKKLHVMNFRLCKVVKKFIYKLSTVKTPVLLLVRTNDDSLFPALEQLIPCLANTT